MASSRSLGCSDIIVKPIALGGNVFGWTIDKDKSFSILDAFVERGFNLIDTANVYSTWVPGNKGGESETIIGQWLKSSGKRDKVVLATKVGMQMGDGGKGLRKAYIIEQAEKSLSRLGVETIDLYQSHEDDSSTPLEETLEAYQQLISEGKIRAIGASNYTASRLMAALKVSSVKKLPAYVSLQPHYNLLEREKFESELEPLCLEERLGVISYYSLASGFLSGKYRTPEDLSKSVRGAGVAKYLDKRGLAVLAALDEVSSRHKSSPAAVSLAWLIARKSVTAPIVSATSLEQLNQLLDAADLVLTSQDIASLDKASAWR